MTALEIVLIILIVLFVGVIVGWRVYKTIRNKKSIDRGSGKPSPCGGKCSGCAYASSCHVAPADKNDGDDIMPEINVRSDISCTFDDLL